MEVRGSRIKRVRPWKEEYREESAGAEIYLLT